MKKLINAVDDVVNESLAGFCAAHSDIVRLGETAPIVLRRQLKPGKVGLVSGALTTGGLARLPADLWMLGGRLPDDLAAEDA